MNLDRDKGILIEDWSGTVLGTEGEAPQTTEIPTRRFIRRADEMAGKAIVRGWDLNTYLEQVFRWKDRFPPHRYLMPYTNSIKRSLGFDAWHVLEREEILNADTSKAHPKSLESLRDYFLNEQEAEDLDVVKDRLSIIGGSGILYADHLAALAIIGQARELMQLAVFRDDLFLDTGLEGKYATGKYFKAKFPRTPLIERDDCKLTALVMTGVADSVSLVDDRVNSHLPWDDLQVLRDRLPDYITVNPGRLHYGRLANALIS